MRKLIAIVILVLAFASSVMAHDVTIGITKSLDDPTPRSTVFPSSLQPVFKHYLVEQKGIVLPQTCAPGCTEITITGLIDGSYTYRVGAVVEVTRSDGTKALATGWSTAKGVTINCGVTAIPDSPELGTVSQVCK